MPARSRDAAAEKQGAVGVVEECLAGCCGAEPTGLASAVVAYGCHARDRRGGAPRIGLLPAVSEALGLQEQNIGPRRRASASQRFAQLIEAGAGAGALGMRQQDERRLAGRSSERAVRRPSRRGSRSDSRRVVESPEHRQSRHCTDQPYDCTDAPQVASSAFRRRSPWYRRQYKTLECNVFAAS